MIDSHAHLCDNRFERDRDQVIRRAQDAGVELIVCPGTDLADSRKAVELAGRSGAVLAAAGMDRESAAQVNRESLAELERLAGDGRCVAIGEIGLDYHYESTPRAVQRAAFEAQLELAGALDLPVIVHCREAFDDCLEILGRRRVRGVMHCFSGDADTVRRCCKLGLMVSFAGPVTYRKAEALREAARATPAEHLMIETDSPYLAPQAVRGKRNEPAHLVHTVRILADVLGLSAQDVDRLTSVNARLLFGLPLAEEPVVVYRIRNSLYVNLTNRCTNQCVFCPRARNPRVAGHWLGLAPTDEPGAEAVISAIGDPRPYDEVVFCGFGEPTLRLEALLAAARWVKERGGRTRLNTNGQADLIAGRAMAPELRGCIDTVSISLNTADPEQYAELCRPERPGAFQAAIDFIRSARQNGLDVVVTTLDYPEIDPAGVERLAGQLGVRFRLRTYRHLG